MRKIVNECMAEVEEEFRAKRLPWCLESVQRLIVEFPKHGRRVDNPPEDEGSDKNTDDSATTHGSDIESNDEDCLMPDSKEELPLRDIVPERAAHGSASVGALDARERMVKEHEEHTIVLQRVLEELPNAGEEACAVTVEETLRNIIGRLRHWVDRILIWQQCCSKRERETKTRRDVEESTVRQRYAAAEKHRR